MCRLISITLLLVAISVALFAQGTTISGNVSGTWTTSGSPYYVRGNITVPAFMQLTINPGVQVIFRGNYNLTVRGILMAQGTNNTNCITFTAIGDSTWSGVFFDSRYTGSTLKYAKFDKVKGGAAIRATNTHNLTIRNCYLQNNTISGNNDDDNRSLISITSCANVVFKDNTINNNNAENIVYFSNSFNDIANNAITEVSGNNISHNIYSITTMTVINENHNTHFSIEDNVVTHNSATTTNYTSCIFLYGLDMDVLNNSISSNQGCGRGGGLFVNASDGVFNISNNTITHNTAADLGGGVYIWANTQVHFTENDIYYNSANYGGGLAVEYSSIPLNNNFSGLDTGLYIFKNAIAHNFGNNGAGVYAGAGDIALVNNVVAYNCALDNDPFFDNGVGVYLNPNGYNRIPTNAVLLNNIIWANDSYEVYFALTGIDDTVYIRNTTIEGGMSGTYYEDPMLAYINTQAVYTADPQFVDPFLNNWHILNADYATLYPGFSNSYPNYVGIYPYDNSVSATEHKRTFTPEWEWISFPILPRNFMTNESVSFYTVANTFNGNVTVFQSQSDYAFLTIYNSWDFFYNSFDIRSTMGFKIKLSNEFNHLIQGTTLRSNTKITLSPSIENWIGYFLPFTQSVLDVFDIDTLKKISSIKTRDGAVYITYHAAGNPVMGPLEYLEINVVNIGSFTLTYPYTTPSSFVPVPTLSFGEMAVVTLNRNINTDHSFYWVQKQVHSPYYRQKTKQFAFNQKADYQSLFIELQSDNPPEEIGAFINGVCKGATVCQSEVMEILLYLDEADLDEEIEIAFAYNDTKAPPKKMNDFAVVNPQTQQLEYKPLIASANTEYYQIKFAKTGNGEPDDVSAPFVQLMQNYPNPFNPDTNIDFYLSHDDNVTLAIYNIKGQRVRDLHNGATSAGKHSVVWNGKDGTGNIVASGIYFYRLTTKLGSVQRKMVLVK